MVEKNIYDLNIYDSGDKEPDHSRTEAGRFLKNPLPVPRRHDWEIPRSQDHFDIDISDDDDFDI